MLQMSIAILLYIQHKLSYETHLSPVTLIRGRPNGPAALWNVNQTAALVICEPAGG